MNQMTNDIIFLMQNVENGMRNLACNWTNRKDTPVLSTRVQNVLENSIHTFEESESVRVLELLYCSVRVASTRVAT